LWKRPRPKMGCGSKERRRIQRKWEIGNVYMPFVVAETFVMMAFHMFLLKGN